MYCSGGCRRTLVLTLCLIGAACNREHGPAAPHKFAVLRFENLSPDSSFDWDGRALSELLGQELGAVSFAAIERAQRPFAPHPVSAPGVSAEQSPARLLGATELVTGYYIATGNGQLAVTAVEEDAATHRVLRTVQASGDVFAVANEVAKAFTAQPKPATTRNATALRLYALGLESQGAAAGSDFEQAAAADPNFGDAYLAWSRAAAGSGDRASLDRALTMGLARGDALPALDRASLSFDAATLRQDLPGRIAALRTIVSLSPDNPGELKALADFEMTAHQLAPAIQHYERAAALAPGNPELLNLLAYAKMFAGDEAGALADIRRYQTNRPQDANAFDSEGDIYFYFSRFADAERLYSKAFAMDAAFDAGLDAWKMARARLMTGDVTGATDLFHKFVETRQKAKDPSMPFREAEWLYLTGHREEGISRMTAAAQGTENRDVRALCLTQAAIWNLTAGQKPAADKLAVTVLQMGNTPSVVDAAVVHFAQQPPVSAEEWRTRASKQINGNGAERVRQLSVAYALLLSHQSSDAAAAWKAIYESESPTDQTPAFLYARALVDAGQTAQAQALLKGNPIPGAVPAASFETLYFPALFAWRGDANMFTKLGGTPAPAK